MATIPSEHESVIRVAVRMQISEMARQVARCEIAEDRELAAEWRRDLERLLVAAHATFGADHGTDMRAQAEEDIAREVRA